MIAKILDNNTIEVRDISQFDIDAIMHSGQVFRYFKKDNGYIIVVGSNFAEICKQGDSAIVTCNDSLYFWNYFDLDTDYNAIKSELHKYQSIRPAIEAGCGIRILRSEFVETVISFIISANNNIKRFTKTLNALAEQYGNRLANGLYAFPTLEQLSVATQADFQTLGCGYRSPYLVKAVQQLKVLNVDVLAKLPPKELDKHLQGIAGVGPKVSACCRLFSHPIHDISICPLDTWLKKALTQINPCDQEVLLNHKYAGIAQQYIFYYLQHLRASL